jgi:lipase ATG15
LTSSKPQKTSTRTTTTCETPGKFWGCYDETTTTGSHTTIPHSITSAPATTTSAPAPTSEPANKGPKTCLHRNWFGFCKEWDGCDQGIDEI